VTVIVTDMGFGPDDWAGGILAPADLAAAADAAAGGLAVEIGPADDPAALLPHIDRLALVRIRFPVFSDGRGFTHARRLRAMGFRGRLRAAGHVIADQYAMARRSGFDEVEIDDALAARQPEAQWRARADWTAHDYQRRLRAG
jgi:uncharacterized protein (DUF934 family)